MLQSGTLSNPSDLDHYILQIEILPLSAFHIPALQRIVIFNDESKCCMLLEQDFDNHLVHLISIFKKCSQITRILAKSERT